MIAYSLLVMPRNLIYHQPLLKKYLRLVGRKLKIEKYGESEIY